MGAGAKPPSRRETYLWKRGGRVIALRLAFAGAAEGLDPWPEHPVERVQRRRDPAKDRLPRVGQVEVALALDADVRLLAVRLLVPDRRQAEARFDLRLVRDQ